MLDKKLYEAFKSDFLDVCEIEDGRLDGVCADKLQSILYALEDGALLGGFFKSHPFGGDDEDVHTELVEELYSEVEARLDANRAGV